MTLTPAYGRDYKSKKAVQADLDAGKDFIIADISHEFSGRYCNLENLQEEGRKEVTIRYGNLRKVGVFKVKKA